jgi:DNA-binding transcriptional ArsR family regulator
VIGVFTASSPLLVAGVVLVASTAAWLNWCLFGLGIWLIAVAAVSGFAGPAGAWGGRAGRRYPVPAHGGHHPRAEPRLSDNGLDPVIHAPARLRLLVTLAALPDGDSLSFTRLQDLIELTPGNLITHLRKLDDAGYVRMDKSGSGVNALTAVALTHNGRAALEHYTAALRQLLDSASPQ